MKTLALLDADIIAFRCSASAENDPQEIAEIRCDELIRKILHDTNSLHYKTFLTGTDNFRKKLFPEYKANRKDKPRPKWLQACRDHLVKYWHAEIVDGKEADDALGIEQTAHELDSVICSIDKDLLQIPGFHYNFVKQEEKFISPFDGMRNFYKQLITGDSADNIPAFDGKLRNSIPKFVQKLLDPLDEMIEELDMYNYAYKVWEEEFGNPLGFKHLEERLHTHASLLYIWRKENDKWIKPGAQQDDTASL
jgi:DNA polymerase-1